MNRRLAGMLAVICLMSACKEDPSKPDDGNNPPPGDPVQLTILGHADVPERFTSEIAATGTWVYTGTWNNRAAPGNVVKIWNATAATPVLVDSLVIQATGTQGDVQISDDGQLLVIASENPGALNLFDRSNP